MWPETSSWPEICRLASQKKPSAHKLLDLGMNGLNVAGALFFVAGTLILLRTVTAEGVGRYLMRTSPGTTPSQ